MPLIEAGRLRPEPSSGMGSVAKILSFSVLRSTRFCAASYLKLKLFDRPATASGSGFVLLGVATGAVERAASVTRPALSYSSRKPAPFWSPRDWDTLRLRGLQPRLSWKTAVPCGLENAWLVRRPARSNSAEPDTPLPRLFWTGRPAPRQP